MNDLIKIENGQLAQQTIDYIISVEKQMKLLKEQYDKFKADLLTAMEQTNTLKFEDDKSGLKISYIGETERETLDTKQLKADLPNLYDEYVRFTKVKPSIRVKVD